MNTDTTQTLDDTQPGTSVPVLVIRFAGCSHPMWCELRDLGPGSEVWETLEIALDELPRGHLKIDENREAPVLTITVKMMDKREFENAEEWYC